MDPISCPLSNIVTVSQLALDNSQKTLKEPGVASTGEMTWVFELKVGNGGTKIFQQIVCVLTCLIWNFFLGVWNFCSGFSFKQYFAEVRELNFKYECFHYNHGKVLIALLFMYAGRKIEKSIFFEKLKTWVQITTVLCHWCWKGQKHQPHLTLLMSQNILVPSTVLQEASVSPPSRQQELYSCPPSLKGKWQMAVLSTLRHRPAFSGEIGIKNICLSVENGFQNLFFDHDKLIK